MIFSERIGSHPVEQTAGLIPRVHNTHSHAHTQDQQPPHKSAPPWVWRPVWAPVLNWAIWTRWLPFLKSHEFTWMHGSSKLSLEEPCMNGKTSLISYENAWNFNKKVSISSQISIKNPWKHMKFRQKILEISWIFSVRIGSHPVFSCRFTSAKTRSSHRYALWNISRCE